MVAAKPGFFVDVLWRTAAGSTAAEHPGFVSTFASADSKYKCLYLCCACTRARTLWPGLWNLGLSVIKELHFK